MVDTGYGHSTTGAPEDKISPTKKALMSPEMKKKVLAAQGVPDADVPIHTDKDVVEHYPGER